MELALKPSSKSTFWPQFLALLERNAILKYRRRGGTLTEILSPLIIVLLVGLMFLLLRPTPTPFRTFKPRNVAWRLESNKTLLLINNPLLSLSIDDIFDKIRSLLDGKISTEVVSNMTRAEEIYRQNPKKYSLALFVSQITSTRYTVIIRSPFEVMPSALFTRRSDERCRKHKWNFCDVDNYLASGFALIQDVVGRVLAQTYLNIQLNDSFVQKLPEAASEPTAQSSISLRIVTTTYLVLAFGSVLQLQVTQIVFEKEKKIRESLRVMGMNDLAFWASWFVAYSILFAIIDLLCTAILLAFSVVRSGEAFVSVFILMFLFTLSLVTLGFAVTPFFNKSKTAGTVAMVVSFFSFLPYIGLLVASLNGHTFPKVVTLLLSLLSPTGFAVGIDILLAHDIFFHDKNIDLLSYSKHGVYIFEIICMLTFDTILYGFIAFYFENVFPGEFGKKQGCFFLCSRTYWTGGKSPSGLLNSGAQSPESLAVEGRESHVERVPNSFRNKMSIRIFSLTKKFKDKAKKDVVALDQLTLDFYEGEISSLLGANSAGKTTIINILTGIYTPTSGTAVIYNQDVSNVNDIQRLRCHIGLCPQGMKCHF